MSSPLQFWNAPATREDSSIAARRTSGTESVGASIAAWLLRAGVQLTDGPHAGGVAGCLDADGRAEYVYPEITGYYLHWLAWHATTAGDEGGITERAAAAQRWIARWLATGAAPATRVYLEPAEADWRNGALFFFDYAMLLRGLALASSQGLVAADPLVVAQLGALLAHLVARDGMFKACVNTGRGSVLPDRWSTRRGAFLAKAAAGIMIAGRELPIAPALVEAADATFIASIRWAVESEHAEAHPFLYAVEGVLSIPEHPAFAAALDALRPQLRRLFAVADATGTVSESSSATGVERMDIVAQALRVGVRLRASGHGDIVSIATLRKLARRLVSHVRSNGALPFDAGRVPVQYNVWAAMFAQQALVTLDLDADLSDTVTLALPPALGLT